MTHHELTAFFLSLGLLLLVARVLAEIARAFNQPAVLGEIIAGILLGPTVLGHFAPQAEAWLFPKTAAFSISLQSLTNLAITLFLLVAGMEVDLSMVWRQGRSSAMVSLFGVVIPFSLGFLCAWVLPLTFGADDRSDRLLFSLFLGTALAISALPVIAKTLMDLKIYRSDFGMAVISVAVIDDLIGWILFAVILGMMGDPSMRPTGIPATIGLTFAFTVFILTIGRWALDRILPPLQAFTSWPGGVLGFAAVGALLCAAFTEWIGIHAIFGAFLFGVALGDSRHLREKTRTVLDQFISFIFAPLFFAGIGLRVDFAANFDWLLILLVLLIACAGKIAGCGLAGRWAGFSKPESLAIGVAMNARGGMGIILALLALEAHLINERMFVALVIMALVTSMMAGGLIQKILKRKRAVRFTDFLPAKGFVADLQKTSRRGVIQELVNAITEKTSLAPGPAAKAVWEREQLMPTGLGRGLAIPHARVEGLRAPRIAVGISKKGVDFDAPDGEPAHLIFLILTPKEGSQIQLQLLAEIGRIFQKAELIEKAIRVPNYVEFRALIKGEGAE